MEMDSISGCLTSHRSSCAGSILQPCNYQFGNMLNETSQDTCRLSEAFNRQCIIVIQVHDKLHENVFISTSLFH